MPVGASGDPPFNPRPHVNSVLKMEQYVSNHAQRSTTKGRVGSADQSGAGKTGFLRSRWVSPPQMLSYKRRATISGLASRYERRMLLGPYPQPAESEATEHRPFLAYYASGSYLPQSNCMFQSLPD
uniref:Uncharacterized protein n=1 Tax=Schistocephalus solidus TaxID=70667 RepID=A0A0X3PDB5_SCHSO